MGAFFSIDSVKTIVEIVILFIGYLKGVLLPDQHGACTLLPKVADQLQELEHRKATDDEDFPGFDSSFSLRKRCRWMKRIHDYRPIGQIIWPGTHYSATNKIGIPFITRPFGQRQTMSIYEQLLNGVRALDIRVQQDGLVCYGGMLCYTTIGDIIKDIKRFLQKAKFEIVILEIQTEFGFSDPENFEDYLVKELGDLLIHQDDQVFSKSISEVLPRRIICIWKPVAHRHGGPLWSAKYLKCDEIDTQMPLTRFDANINNLRSRSLDLNTNNFFYKVENTLNPKTSTILESLLIWPKHANVLSKRINGFARLFLAKCHNDGILHRLQICSVDFVDDDFVSACIGLNYEVMAIKQNEDTPITLEEVNTQTDATIVHEATQEEVPNSETTSTSRLHFLEEEESSLVNITTRGSNDMNIISINDINSTRDNDTTENDYTTIASEKDSYVWLAPSNLKTTRAKDDSYYNSALGAFKNVSGEYKIDELPQGIRYEVLFKIRYAWSLWVKFPIQLRLILPDGSCTEENQVISDRNLIELLYIGNFLKSQEMKGNIKFSIELPENTLKDEICVEGVIIRPSYIDIVMPGDLKIKFHDVGECWRWPTFHSSIVRRNIIGVKLISVKDLQVHGEFETRKLLIGFTYKVSFLIAMSSEARGWESSTKLSLLLPNGILQQRETTFKNMPGNGDSKKIYVGEFMMSPELNGKLKFSMKNINDVEKSGMTIEMALIELQLAAL